MTRLTITIGLGLIALSSQVAYATEGLNTCASLGLNVGQGFSAKKGFSNDDYDFSVRIPDGKVAWSGVDIHAPFHGFGVALGGEGTSCIDFYLEWRVNADEPPARPVGLTPFTIRGATAEVSQSQGVVGRSNVINRTVYFTRTTARGIVDGTISLVSNEKTFVADSLIFDKFVRSLSFPRKP